MVGKNILKMNQATMREALREYLGKRYEVATDEEIVIEKVERATSPTGAVSAYDAMGGDFDITLNVAKKNGPPQVGQGG